MDRNEFYGELFPLIRKAKDGLIPENIVLDECKNAMRVCYRPVGPPILAKWDKLRNWLTNLKRQKTTKKTAKIGLQIALNMMDRLDEGETKK